MPEVDEFQVLLGSPVVAEELDKKYSLLLDFFAIAGTQRTTDGLSPTGKAAFMTASLRHSAEFRRKV